MPQYNGKPVLTIGKADQCRSVIEAWLDSIGARHGALYKPGHEGDYWCYSLEGDPDGWPMLLSGSSAVSPVVWPPGVWTEAVNNVSLALHPA